MKKFKISIKGIPPEQSAVILKALWKCLNEKDDALQNDPESCGMTIAELVNCYMPFTDLDRKVYKRTLRRIALHAYGNNLPLTTRQLSDLILVGNGECPECGSDDINDLEYEGECRTCGKVFWIDEVVERVML